MKRILVKKILVVAFLAFLAEVSWGAVFCVNTATELQNALDAAGWNGEDDIIKVAQGTYIGNFSFSSNEGQSITLLGGYTSDCADRVINPSNTILDGGGSGVVLFFDNWNGGDILIEGFTIQNGDADNQGVGVSANSFSNFFDIRKAGDITLNNNIITGNIAPGNFNGAGVMACSYSGSYPTGNVTLTNNTITGNTSGGQAGGVSASTYSETGIAGDVILINNIITGNTAFDYAGGVEAITNSPSGTAGNIILANNTITENTANSQGGGLSIYQPADRNLYVYNNIIWGNTAPAGGDIYFFLTGISNGYNNDYSDMYGSWTNSGNNINEDPLFVGGDNYQLQDISPCIDAGDNSAPELPEFDFVGSLRIIDGDGDGTAIVDMGAYEYVIYNLTIETSTGGTTDPSPAIYSHLGGTEVTITAWPDDNYRFSGWAGDVPLSQENDNPITITMDSDKSITANFTATPPEETGEGDGDGKKGGCFIATAAYGSPLHPHLDILRDFRDRYLMPKKLGCVLVGLYYKYSPFAAELITKHKALKAAVKINLLPLVAFSYSMVHFGPITTTVLIAVIFILPGFLILFLRRKQPRLSINCWKDADSGIPEVEDAKKRLGELKSQRP